MLPGAVASEIFHTAGLIEETGAAAAREAQSEMLQLLPHTMDARTAAANIFDQAAAGEFYLLPQPKYVGEIMRRRGAQLAERSIPAAPDRGDPSRFAADLPGGS